MKKRPLLPSMMRLLRQAQPDLSFRTLQTLMRYMTVAEEDSGDAATVEDEEEEDSSDSGAGEGDSTSSPPFEDMSSPEDGDVSRAIERLIAVRAATPVC